MGKLVPFNPLGKTSLAGSIEHALSREEPTPLKSLERFPGSGIYSLYYTGTFPSYDPLTKSNRNFFENPIYVGKANSKGKRKGGFLEESAIGETLWKRLCEHSTSIEQTENLDCNDFFCRFLIVDDLWISLGESLLISKYSPLWNTLVDGFGNHDPGSGRHSGKCPRWDTLHPGRSWATKLVPNPMTSEQISIEVLKYLTDQYPTVKISQKVSFDYSTESVLSSWGN